MLLLLILFYRDGDGGLSVLTTVHIKTTHVQNTLQLFEIKQTYTSALQEVTVSIFCFTVQQFGISTTERIFNFSSVLKPSCNFYRMVVTPKTEPTVF
jgi:hypothetical protein